MRGAHGGGWRPASLRVTSGEGKVTGRCAGSVAYMLAPGEGSNAYGHARAMRTPLMTSRDSPTPRETQRRTTCTPAAAPARGVYRLTRRIGLGTDRCIMNHERNLKLIQYPRAL